MFFHCGSCAGNKTMSYAKPSGRSQGRLGEDHSLPYAPLRMDPWADLVMMIGSPVTVTYLLGHLTD